MSEPDRLNDIFVCDNCGRKDEHDRLPFAKDLALRLTPGHTYTDVECPACGALCYPDEIRIPAREESRDPVKFVLFEYGFAVFSPVVQHAHMSQLCEHSCGVPVRAGFAQIVGGEIHCYGESISLNLKAGTEAGPRLGAYLNLPHI